MAVWQCISAGVCNGVVTMWTWPTRGGDVAALYRILRVACGLEGVSICGICVKIVVSSIGYLNVKDRAEANFTDVGDVSARIDWGDVHYRSK